MMRTYSKKAIIFLFSLLTITVITFQLVKLIPKTELEDNQLVTSVFNNGFFDRNLSKTQKAEEMIPFNQIHQLIETYMNQSFATPGARDTAMKNALSSLINNRRISIGTADDLYHFSTSVSYNWIFSANESTYPYFETIEFLLDQDYALVSDIDYSTMRAKKFNPIGIDLDLPGENDPIYPFTGSFDGQGFTISNLYVADYSYITTIYSFDGDPQNNQDFPLIRSYSMFALVGETGVIKNLVLRNPSYELLDAPEGLTRTSMFVGFNSGTIYNVAVIDIKTNLIGESISGNRFIVQFSQSGSTSYTAAGFVHTNNETGKIYNSYFISQNIMAQGSKFRFNEKPFVYENLAGGTIENVAYDQMVIPYVDDLTQPSTINSYTTQEFRSGLSGGLPISINGKDLDALYGETRFWRYYVLDSYPMLFGLNYQGGAFEISNEFELIAFNKLIGYNTPFNGLTYDQHNYRLTDDIDMKNLTGYLTPVKDFRGTFSGGVSEFSNTPTNSNYYIYNLSISRPAIVGSNYYMGLFSSVSGTVKNINLMNNSLTLTNTLNNYGRVFSVGAIAGTSTSTANIRNIVSDTSINLGTTAIGRSYVGGIVGLASGSISYTANLGNIEGNMHNFNNLTINGVFSIGGIVGGTSNSTLILKNSVNDGEIRSVGLTPSTQFNASGGVIINRVGGIIGEINNISTTNHSVYYVTNNGNVKANDFAGKSNGIVTQNLGGIFGETLGLANQITNSTSPVTFRNGRWENQGDLIGSYVNTFTTLNAAGIGVVSTTTNKAEFSYMTNSGSYQFSNYNYGTHNTHIFYASTIIDNSTGGIILSRAYNTASYTYETSFFSTNSGISVSNIDIAPFFTSKNNLDKELNFVENRGEIFIGSTSALSNVQENLRVAGITLSNNIDFRNVSYEGYFTGDTNRGITLLNINNSAGKEVFVAGITYAIPYNTQTNRAYTMNNVSNKASIIVADFKGNSILSSHTAGQNGGASTFSSIFSSSNLYIAGIVNLNVGELTNVFNFGDISSTYSTAIRDIDGLANTFVGGISTINYNSIQDAANSGNLTFINNANGTNYISSINDPGSTAALFAGLTYAYDGGLVIGGISAALADTNAIILTGIGRNANITAEVLDSANNGDVFGRARQYVRTGGIVAVALGLELTAGTDNATTSNVARRFSYNATGSQDPVSQSLVSNGLNFGNVTAITQTVFVYTASEAVGTRQRPGIYSSAGGVVGYGLFRMKRMLNHGVIAATDVAGGIVGATYIVGSTGSSTIPTTIVDIDTAVHYGRVEAARTGTYASFDYEASKLYGDNTRYYADTNQRNNFLFPSNSTPISVQNKPGFGGIFGRLQRGTYGMMQSDNFINILNMDANIDMTGRTDQSTVDSLIYYRFSLTDRDDTYYSARTNDTTPGTLIGYYTGYTRNYSYSSAQTVQFRITRTGLFSYRYWVNGITVSNGNGGYIQFDTRRVGIFIPGGSTTYTYAQVNNSPSKTIQQPFQSQSSTALIPITNTTPSTFGISNTEAQNAYNAGGARTITRTNYGSLNFSQTVTASSVYGMEKVTDISNPLNPDYDPNKTYIFNTNFPLMDAAQSNFIYYAKNEVLVDRFKEEYISGQKNPSFKEDGMYVLASTKGRDAGAVLPANVSISNFYGLKETVNPIYYDLNNISNSDLNMPSQEDMATDRIYMAYSSMFQVRKSDKSAILPKVNQPTIGDIRLIDPNGQNPTLEGGIIDKNNQTITFNVSTSAFPFNSVYYEVDFATLSENAVIAIGGINEANHSGFKNAYLERQSNILDGIYKPTFNGTFSSNQITFIIHVYSEIAADDPDLVNIYKTEYEVIINRVPTPLNITLNQIIMDGNNVTPLPLLSGSTYTVSSSFSMLPSGNMTVRFNDVNNLLPIGHNVFIQGLYKDDVLVDSAYYNVTYIPKSGSVFGFNISLSEELESQDYDLRYSYYNSSSVFTINFNKQTSTNRFITDTVYQTYSFDELGNLGFTPTSSNFTTFLEFGEIIEGVLYQQSTGLTIHAIENGTSETYLNTIESYELRLAGNTIMTLYLSPFASVTQASVYYEYDITDGRKNYIFTYRLSNEANQTADIIHTVKERPIDTFIVYKNGNQQFSYPVFVAREDLMTYIQVDFNFQDSNLYQQVATTIRDKDTNNIFIPSINEIQIFNDNGYEIDISYLLGTGSKLYSFTLEREFGFAYELGVLEIEKALGIDAYISDINFQLGSDITILYPDIYEINSLGQKVVNSAYDTRIFFDGIDYDGANLNGVRYFRIDGKVSDIDITNYRPDFSLPFGAVIQRQVSPGVWTDDLFTNFISENELEDQVIRYRVLSETVYLNNIDNFSDILDTSIVYYDLTAVDILYNLTIRFTLYYRFSNGTIVEAGATNSPINTSVVLISLRNYELIEGTYDVITNPVTGDITYPYEGFINDYVNGIKNQSTLFYYPLPQGFTNYVQTFGRNTTGAYGFSVVTPKYSGVTQTGLTNGLRYDYSIYLRTNATGGTQFAWNHPNYLLPNFDSTGEIIGRYYYTPGSLRQIIREFAIVIEESTLGNRWGLYDDYTSWDDPS